MKGPYNLCCKNVKYVKLNLNLDFRHLADASILIENTPFSLLNTISDCAYSTRLCVRPRWASVRKNNNLKDVSPLSKPERSLRGCSQMLMLVRGQPPQALRASWPGLTVLY